MVLRPSAPAPGLPGQANPDGEAPSDEQPLGRAEGFWRLRLGEGTTEENRGRWVVGEVVGEWVQWPGYRLHVDAGEPAIAEWGPYLGKAPEPPSLSALVVPVYDLPVVDAPSAWGNR